MFKTAELRKLLHSIESGLVVRDSRKRIVFANHAASKLTGIPRTRFRGSGPVRRSGIRLLDAEGREVDWDQSPFEIAHLSKSPLVNHHCGIRLVNDETRWLTGTYIPLTDREGTVQSVIGSFGRDPYLESYQALRNALQQTALQSILGVRLSLEAALASQLDLAEIRNQLVLAVSGLDRAAAELRACLPEPRRQ